MKRANIALAFVFAMLLISPISGCVGETREPGILEGHVTIGPIWPVERPGEQKPIPPEVYEARKVMVYDKSGKRLFEEVSLSSDGYYKVELRSGTYTIDINRIGIDSSSDVPKQLVIESGQAVVLNIDIDTGIR
ncbi:hypothetical protein ACFLVY_02615 [Chloroflexota bacterium]